MNLPGASGAERDGDFCPKYTTESNQSKSRKPSSEDLTCPSDSPYAWGYSNYVCAQYIGLASHSSQQTDGRLVFPFYIMSSFIQAPFILQIGFFFLSFLPVRVLFHNSFRFRSQCVGNFADQDYNEMTDKKISMKRICEFRPSMSVITMRMWI